MVDNGVNVTAFGEVGNARKASSTVVMTLYSLREKFLPHGYRSRGAAVHLWAERLFRSLRFRHRTHHPYAGSHGCPHPDSMDARNRPQKRRERTYPLPVWRNRGRRVPASKHTPSTAARIIGAAMMARQSFIKHRKRAASFRCSIKRSLTFFRTFCFSFVPFCGTSKGFLVRYLCYNTQLTREECFFG